MSILFVYIIVFYIFIFTYCFYLFTIFIILLLVFFLVFIYYFTCINILTFSEITLLLLNIIIIINSGFLVSYEYFSGCMSFTGMALIPKTKPG